jgi:hypothetical protein
MILPALPLGRPRPDGYMGFKTGAGGVSPRKATETTG